MYLYHPNLSARRPTQKSQQKRKVMQQTCVYNLRGWRLVPVPPFFLFCLFPGHLEQRSLPKQQDHDLDYEDCVFDAVACVVCAYSLVRRR